MATKPFLFGSEIEAGNSTYKEYGSLGEYRGDGYGSGAYGRGFHDAANAGAGRGEGDDLRSNGRGPDQTAYWEGVIVGAIAALPADQAKRVAALRRRKARFAIWRSKANGQPKHPSAKRVTPPAPGVVHVRHSDYGDAQACGTRAVHASVTPLVWGGPRFWLVAMLEHDEYDDTKIAAKSREIICELFV